MSRVISAIVKFTIFAVLLGAAIWWQLSPPKVGDNLVLINGTIITVDNEMSIAEAVWIKDGRIMAVGNKADVMAQADGASTYDLDGQIVLPGLIEPHTHPFASAMLGQAIDVSGFRFNNKPAILDELNDAGTKGSGPLIAFGWDPVMVDDLDAPSMAQLNRISRDRPVIILTQMMHDAYANEAAFRAASIDKDTTDPAFIRDFKGRLTGTVREVDGISQLIGALPKAPKGALDLLLNIQLRAYAQAGYTTIGALGPSTNEGDPLGMIEGLANRADTAVRAIVYALPEQLEDAHWQPGLTTANDRFTLRGVKFWMDGSPFAGGAAFDEPYEDTPLTRERLHLPPPHNGSLNYSEVEFEALFTKYHTAGYAIAVHVQGERAVRRVLNVAERVLKAHPRPDHRHRLEHNALITKDQMARAKQMGFTLSFFVDHIYYYGHRLPELVGDKRTARYMPLADAAQSGHRVTIHTDNPATPIGPFRAYETAVTRKSRRTELPIAPDQALDRETALRAMTINSAWQLGLDKDVGSIEVGKRADLTFVADNPLTMQADQLQLMQVNGTWLDGQPADTRLISLTNLTLLWSMVWANL